MPDKKYLIEIPGMEGADIWDADRWERNKDRLLADHPDTNVFEVGAYDANDEKDTDQFMISMPEMDGADVWDSDRWNRNKDAFMKDNPQAEVNRVRYVDYWGQQAEANRARKAELQKPDEGRNARLAELGYYDDITGGQTDFNLGAPNMLNLKPLSSALSVNSVSGEAEYSDPMVEEFFVNDTAETERMAEIARLDAEYDSNPSVIAQREWEAEMEKERAAYVSKMREETQAAMDKNVDKKAWMQGYNAKHMPGTATAFATSGRYGKDDVKAAEENAKAENYQTAMNYWDKAERVRKEHSTFGQGVKNVAKNWWEEYRSQDDIETFAEVASILKRLEKEQGDLKDISEEAIEKTLTEDEKFLVKSFLEYSQAMAEAGADMSTWYKGGQIAAEAVPFMLEILATGGLYKSAGDAALGLTRKGLAKWIMKSAKGSAARGAKAKVAKALTSKAGAGVISALAGTAARTAVAPGTYTRMAEATTEIDKDGHLNIARNAGRAAVDMYIENLSEVSGKAFGEVFGWIGRGVASTTAGKWATGIGKTAFSKVGSFLGDNAIMQKLIAGYKAFAPKLEALGFHGIFEEVGEEILGNALREVTFVQPGALKEMFEDDNFGAMLIGFAPMTILGAVGSAANIAAVNAKAAELGKSMREMMAGHHDQKQIDHMMSVIENAEDAEQMQQAISPMLASISTAVQSGQITEEQGKEEAAIIYRYGMYVAQNKAMIFAKQKQDNELADAKRGQMTERYGKFWQEGENGEQSVQVAQLNDGRTVFITSAPAEDGMVTIIDGETGKAGFANVSDIATEEVEGESVAKSKTRTMADFLDHQIAMERKTAEQARMTNERNAQIDALRAEITPGTKINLGTEGSPVIVFAKGTNQNGVVIVDQNGIEHILGWEQAADALGKPIRVKTDKQIVDEEIAAIAKRDAERRKKIGVMTPASEEASQQVIDNADEVVRMDDVHIPMNEDGTVNEAAFWEQNPEEYAKWNDEQNQDGGADTLMQIANTKAELQTLIANAQSAMATSNPAERKAAKRELERLIEKMARLEALEQTYVQQALAPFRERVQKWMSLTGATVHILETEEELASISLAAASQSASGKAVTGFAKDGKAYIYLPAVTSEQEIDAVFVHEAVSHVGLKGLLGEQQFNELCEQVWNMMSEEAKRVFMAYPGVNGNHLAAADEYIAHIAENIGAGVTNEIEKSIWDKIVEFVRNILRAMGVELAMTEQELSDLLSMSYADLAKNMESAEAIAQEKKEAQQVERELPTAAQQRYSELAESLTPDEIKAVAENDFNAAQEAYNAHVANAPRVEVGESSKSFIERKKKYNEELAELEANLAAEQALMDEITRLETAQNATAEAGEEQEEEGDGTMIRVNVAEEVAEPGTIMDLANQQEPDIRFSIRTEDYLEEQIRNYAKSREGKKAGWTPQMVDDIIEETKSLITAIHNSSTGNEFYDEFAAKDPTIKLDWRDGQLKPTVTWTRANIEYKYDMSADLLCVNNEGLEEVLSSDKMVALMEMFNTSKKDEITTKTIDGKEKTQKVEIGFSQDDYLELYNTLKDLGFVVPCKGCFDAAGRFKMLPSVAYKFAAAVNAVIDERNANPEAFDAALKSRAKKNPAVNGLPTSAKTKLDAIRAGVAGDNLTEHVKWTQLMSADGQTKMLSDWGGIFRAWQRTGAGRPKDKLLPEPYYGDIVSSHTTIIGAHGAKTPSFRDIDVNQGTGLRRNSHSEFRPVLAVDEIQFMRDAFIKGLTVFKYMKELDDVRLFGKMGVKFNMSFFPEYVPGTKAAGLDKDGNYIPSEESVGAREFPYTGEDGKVHYDGMKGWQEAQKHVNKDVSLSSVILSIPHLIKAMTDVPTTFDKSGIWGSLIPFHSSGATSLALSLQGLGKARANGVGHGFEEAFTRYGEGVTNFEAVQNDRFGKGWVIVEGDKAGEAVEEGHKLEFVNGKHYYNREMGLHLYKSMYVFDSELPEGALNEDGTINLDGKALKKVGHEYEIDYNDKVREIGTPTAYAEAADYYLDLLPKLGLKPRFDFEVPEDVFLQMCADANVDPMHPKLGWKGAGNAWNPIHSAAYYSLFCDYGMTDPATGEWAPHNPVGYVNENGEREFRMPENAVEIVREGLDRYSNIRRSESAKIDEAIEEFARRSVEKGRISKEDVDKVLGDNVRFRTLDEVNTQFNNELQQQIAGTLPANHVYYIGNPSQALLYGGVENLPIEMSAKTLQVKAASSYVHNHPFDLNDVVNLPKAIQMPIAIFDSEEQNGKKVVLTELVDKNGKNFLAIINVRKTEARNYIEFNSVLSLYPKDSNARIAKWFDSERAKLTEKGEPALLKWADKKKASIWLANHSSDVNAIGLSYKRIAKIINNFPETNDQDSERFRISPRTDEQREKLFADAKEKYGVTDNFNAAGYMLPDGSLLDFSEANDGGDPNSRSLDHRDIEGVIMDNGVEYDSRWMYIADFMKEGAIRLLPESAGINMIQAPTEEQRKKIFDFIYKYNGEVILEINDERLNSIAYMEYDRRTSPARIFRDIDGYFNEGIVPEQTSDLRFSIIGERGAMNDKTEEGLARLANLEVARQMESQLNPDWSAKNDENALKIKVATGWERGADSLWRYEVEDLKSKPYSEWLHSKKKLRLKDVVEPNPIMDMYPEVGEISIKKGTAKKTWKAFYRHKAQEIELPFGALKYWEEIVEKFEKKYQETLDECRLYMEQSILHEVQHAIQYREGFALGAHWDSLLPEYKEKYQELQDKFAKLANEYNALYDYEKTSDYGYALRRKALWAKEDRDNYFNRYKLGMEGYMKVSGEAEARNVEERMKMPVEERRNSLLASTEDVARKDQIFIMEAVEDAESSVRFRVLDTTKAELKEKPIKMNGAHRFKLKSAFKGIKDSSGQFGYVTTQIHVGNETMEDPYRVRFDGSLEGYAVIYIRPDLAKITEDEEKEHTFYLDPMPIKDALWEALKAAENYYEAKYANGPWAKFKNPGPFGYSDWQNADKDSESSIRFRVSNNNQAIFVSNAARAVEGIKMEKATPEQWLKMLEKAGGLKAGEDKWMGLSDWLKASDKKTLTKQEVLDFINENMIIIEEQHYSNQLAYENNSRLMDEKYPGWQDAFSFEWDDYRDAPNADILDEEEAATLYNKYNEDKVEIDEDGEIVSEYDRNKVVLWGEDIAKVFFGQEGNAVRPIHDTREVYTTKGLVNNHEIALTVPTIESWGESDMIHFGDAGDGRAVAWIRFGETTTGLESNGMRMRSRKLADELEKKYGSMWNSDETYEQMSEEDKAKRDEADRLYHLSDVDAEWIENKRQFANRMAERGYAEAAERERREADEAERLWSEYRAESSSKKVLVIDEIQSKRHQEGREKGYQKSPKMSLAEYRQKIQDFEQEMIDKYHPKDLGLVPFASAMRGIWSEEESNTYSELITALGSAAIKNIGIPDAPFDKNWHELAMKRMLRYAAENGYDVIAWTKGEQQAERYGLQQVIDGIFVGAWDESTGTKFRPITLSFKDGHIDTLAVNEDGFVFDGTYKGSALADVVGKDMAVRLMTTESRVISDEGLKIGGEGMKGFYDKMLPAFMNKYGKKWGVKVEDINLPNLGKSGYTMHSIPVTEEMKASVMEGQVMFRVRGENESAEEFHQSVVDEHLRKYNDIAAMEVFPIDEATAKRFGYTLDQLKKLSGLYDSSEDLIAIFAKEEETDSIEVEDTIFHESVHKLVNFFDYLKEVGEWMWSVADKYKVFADIKKRIEQEYSEDEYAEEMMCFMLGGVMPRGLADGLLYGMPEHIRKQCEQIFNEIGYDSTRESIARLLGQNGESAVVSGMASEENRTDEGRRRSEKEQEGSVRFRATEITPEVRDEMDTIAATALVNGNYMKAPNGADTNLTAEQWAMVRTKNFKAWFGDWENDPENASKVVDENGEPKVVFHGSNWRPVLDEQGKAIFKMRGGLMGKGSYFTDNINTALYFAADKYEIENAVESVSEGFLDENGYITEVFLNIRNEENIRTVLDDTYYLATSPSQIKSATDNTGEFSEGEGDIRFSIRTKPAPKKTGIGYKVFYLKDGKLYPPMVANLGGVDTPVLVWLDADAAPQAATSKTGRKKVKAGGKGTQGGSGTLAYRPGWHLGEIPYALQFNRGPKVDNPLGITGKNGKVIKVGKYFPNNFVWAEVEYANEVDYQDEAMSYGYNEAGNFQHSLAGLPKVPEDGSYIYRTNANPATDPWIITGAMKVTRLLTPSEVDQMVIDAGREPQERQEGAVTDEQIKALNKELGLVEEEVSFRVAGTPTEDVVAEGVSLSPAQLASLAGDIFSALPEDSRKKITDGLNGNILNLQDAILQIPTSLATKEEWNDEDKELASVVREKVQDMVDAKGVTSRPLTTKEALWMLYDSISPVTDLVSAASRALVAHNLGFDPASMQRKKEEDDYIRFSIANQGVIDAATDMYNYETSLWTERLKESWLDMNQSVVALQNAMADASGMPIEPWENIVYALNRLSSKSYAAKKKYLRDFLKPLWDAVIRIMKHTDFKIEDIERYMMLKHALERNMVFAKRDAREFYRGMFDEVARKMKSQSHAEQVVELSEAKKALADIDAQIATATGAKLQRLQDERINALYRVEVANLVLRGDEKQNEDDLKNYYDAIDAELDPKYLEFREKDYGGLTSMYTSYGTVNRSKYKSEEAYQKAVLAMQQPIYDNVADMESAARMEVDRYEQNMSPEARTNLWDKVNAATKETLRHQYESGMLTIEQYEAVRDMFEFYIPLRGFADNTAEDMYSYYMNNSSNGFSMPVIGAKGRTTRAESPLGWIGTMAESAIQADNKNEAKMCLYYAIMRRPDQNLLSITETWFEYTGKKDANGKKIYAPAYPPATTKALNADELRQHMEDWEDDMKKKQASGNAFKGTQSVNLRGSVVFQEDKQEKEHVIRVKVAGKEYSILVNGNPRAAQAINGLLNPDANVSPVMEWIGWARRGLSSLLTSYSPLFWIANYQRDLLSSAMRISEADGWGETMRYLNNRRKAWRVASYVYKKENRTLGDTYYENLYKEFVDNGGVTGYTALTTNKEYEKLLTDYAKEANNPSLIKWGKKVFANFMSFGEAIEQVSRFAAYITAREAGKPIEEAVNAAKEVSVNFNRKGSTNPISREELEKLRTKSGKKLNGVQKAVAVVLSAMPMGLKELYFFFNASVQAITSSIKLAAKSPGKAATWAGAYFGMSIAMAMLNYLLAGDDDDEYLDLPDYLRHSTILIKVGDEYYIKWSIPQEMRPFYAWADMIVSKMMGKMPHKILGKEMALAAAQWLPVNPFEAEDPLLSLVPDVASPIVEAATNKTSFGGRIYDDMAFKSEGTVKDIPAYRKATDKTGKMYVELAEILNTISGGDEVQKGWANVNPAALEHIVEGYGGGIYDFAKMMVALPGMVIDASTGEEEMEIKNIPFVNKVVMSVDETNMYSHTNDAFYHYKKIAESAKRIEKEYAESDNPERAEAYRQEEDWRIYLLYKQYEADFKDVKERIDNAVDDTETDLLKQEQNVLREMFLNDIAKGELPEITFQIREDVKRIDKEVKAAMKPVNDANKERLERRKAGDVDGMLKAIEKRDSLKETPEYRRAEEINEDLKEIKKQMSELGTVARSSQKDSVLGELQKKYNALIEKMKE